MALKQVQAEGKILLVDDDPGLLRLLSIRLRAEGYEVEAVESAALALGVLHRFSPDLVISDLRMDKMDGIGLLKELQTRSPGLRVVIITAHGTIPDAVTATQHGAFGFLTKPIDMSSLLQTLAVELEGLVPGQDGLPEQDGIPEHDVQLDQIEQTLAELKEQSSQIRGDDRQRSARPTGNSWQNSPREKTSLTSLPILVCA